MKTLDEFKKELSIKDEDDNFWINILLMLGSNFNEDNETKGEEKCTE